jgi:hypothetical protein
MLLTSLSPLQNFPRGDTVHYTDIALEPLPLFPFSFSACVVAYTLPDMQEGRNDVCNTWTSRDRIQEMNMAYFISLISTAA